MSVDLGQGRKLKTDYYCLRHGYNCANDVLRNWRLEGSNDGSAWSPLRVHNNDASLAKVQFSTASWSVEGVAESYQHFRILQTGKNSPGNDHLMCAGIELYGLLTEE